MKVFIARSFFLSSIILSACASQGGWTPTVDSYHNTKANLLKQYMAECKQFALQTTDEAKDTQNEYDKVYNHCITDHK
jgi:hypothetical protein